MISTKEIIQKLDNHFPGHTFELRPIDDESHRENNKYGIFMDGESVYVQWSALADLPLSQEAALEADKYLVDILIEQVQKYIDHISKRS